MSAFGRFVAGCSRVLASPWAYVGLLVYIVVSSAVALLSGNNEQVQLWLSRLHQYLSLFLLLSLHAEEEQKS